MREALIVLFALTLAFFLVTHYTPQAEYYEYKGMLRAYSLYAELQSIEPRALIYARYKVDSFLYSMNGSPCDSLPRIDDNEFRETIASDLSDKAFLPSIDLSFEAFETRGGEKGYFGESCRNGGIGFTAKGRVSIEDGLTGIRGERSIDAMGCQVTAYYRMKRVLDWLERDIKAAVPRCSRHLDSSNLSAFFSCLKEAIAEMRKEYASEDLELRISFSHFYWFEDEEPRVYLHFYITLKDPYAVIIANGREYKGFVCLREMEIGS
ncbi:MAG: hypothetical protein LM591_00120 [Candidatus Korarchaeum sp.]|nr:hypothetical protein [Candidatus Korarchaeum sp.]